jgi:hypothetical protein
MVLQGLIWRYVLVVCLYAQCESVVILDAPREGEGGKNFAELHAILLHHTVKLNWERADLIVIEADDCELKYMKYLK